MLEALVMLFPDLKRRTVLPPFIFRVLEVVLENYEKHFFRGGKKKKSPRLKLARR